MNKLKINEIFFSIQGEGNSTGIPFIFIRTSGCALACSYCDTSYARKSGKFLSISEIIKKIKVYPCQHVLLTGGEPFDQPASKELIKALLKKNYKVFVETNGSHSIKTFPKKAIYIIDIKTPSSKMEPFMHKGIINEIHSKDEIKFVIGTKNDYEYSKKIIKNNMLFNKNVITLSPVTGKLPLKKLAYWILKDGLKVRLGMQLHKHIWPDKTKGV